MNIWNQAPLIRLILPFIAGALTAIHFPYSTLAILVLLSILMAVLAATVFLPFFSFSYKNSFVFGIIINCTLFLFAFQLTICKTDKFDPRHFSKFVQENNFVHAKLTSPLIEKERSMKAAVQILSVNSNGKWRNTSGRSIFYFKKNRASRWLQYGDEILVKATFKEIRNPSNPGVFNYKRFLAFHNIYEQSFIKNEGWIILKRNSGNTVMEYSLKLRDQLLEILKQNNINGDEFSVGAALMLGYTDKLDDEIISAYSGTGALHVLSVSGLHVAIVYFVFNWLLFFLDKIKQGHILKTMLLILFLWFYAALTGLSPSVLRAGTMFSFIIVAKAFKKHTNIYNTLAASAFFLLLFDPFLLMDIGFQLSYLAVIGIVYIQPMIYSWFEVSNWISDQLWKITSVSIAAQIATFPLGLYYFHQFPNYFLLSNLIVIPVSTLILYFGIALFSFSLIPVLMKYLALVFSWLIWLLNSSVIWIDSLPGSLLEGISVSAVEICLIYGMISVFLVYFTIRIYKYLICGLVLTAILLFLQLAEQNSQLRQNKLIIYDIAGGSAIDLIQGASSVLFTDPHFAENDRSLHFNVKNNWWELGIRNNKIMATDCLEDNYIQLTGKRIAMIRSERMMTTVHRPLMLDYLIISGNSKSKIKDLVKLYDTGMFIFDSSNSKQRIKKWEEECILLGKKYYSVPENGAFVINL